jgi:tetratricopeptide (TPR) repeat protein
VNPENNTITKRNANIKLAIGMSVAFLIGLSIFSVFCYVPEPDNSDKYAELGQISQQWSDIYYYMDVTKDYDSALKKLDEIMEDTGAENVYLYYAKCLVGKGEYDNAAESLITYIKKIYKYPNMTSKTKDSYVFLQSLENQVSKEELEKIIKVKKEAEKYIDKWEQASDKLKNQDYDGAIEIIDELIDEGAKIDVAYFMKIECLLGKGEKSKAQAVYKEYMEKKDKLEGYEIVDYSTADYNYLEEIYEKIK